MSRKRRARRLRWASALAVLLLAIATHPDALPVAHALARDDAPFPAALDAGDRAWSARAETLSEPPASAEDDHAAPLAEPARIDEAIRQYRAALAAEPDSLAARWKLLRALHYSIDFTTLPDQTKDERSEDAIELARDAAERLAKTDASDADRARVLFWSAIAWGTRAQRVGLLTIVREGVAKKMHDFAARSLELDPSVDRGGALRLLSRLHATLPRVPFVSGWVDRDRGLELAERAHALDAEHPGNTLILALALLELAPERAEEARALLERVAASEPRAGYRVEDLAIRAQARERLAELDG